MLRTEVPTFLTYTWTANHEDVQFYICGVTETSDQTQDRAIYMYPTSVAGATCSAYNYFSKGHKGVNPLINFAVPNAVATQIYSAGQVHASPSSSPHPPLVLALVLVLTSSLSLPYPCPLLLLLFSLYQHFSLLTGSISLTGGARSSEIITSRHSLRQEQEQRCSLYRAWCTVRSIFHGPYRCGVWRNHIL